MPRVVRVLTDVRAIDKEFDYLLPDRPAVPVDVGTIVRVPLHGRPVGGWVVGLDSTPPDGVDLLPIRKISGYGPAPDLIELARWAAWRWAGRRTSFLRVASPERLARALPAPALRRPPPPAGLSHRLTAMVEEALEGGTRLLTLPPAFDLTAVVALVAQQGATLVVVPSADRAGLLGQRLAAAGADVALLPSQWARARAGAAVVIGARGAAWGPCPGLAAVVVVDAHDETLVETSAPTWHPGVVAAERAARAGVPCVWVTPCPTVEQLAVAPAVRPSVELTRRGWAPVEIVDRRLDDPRLGLYSERVVRSLRTDQRVVLVLNRVGRAQHLACASCGQVASCARCGAGVRQGDANQPPYPLHCPRCDDERPAFCLACGSTVLKHLRVGVSRAREELEALAGRPVGEVTASTGELPATDVLVGTEAVLHRILRANTVVFLEMDQELLAARYRAGEEALALLARAARTVGGRRGRVIVQTRLPEHPALQAALHADPSRLSGPESDMRAALSFPPASALAAVSGPAAGAYIEQLRAAARHHESFEVLGPDDGHWLLRAADHERLCSVLASVPRPPGRLRVAVDPLRV